ncbi:MAG TPA: C1 family peptidase [Patescibacteria group bacterium]|nr:C1 family peptidase [Patescibacteria group bacterium]
MKGGKERNRKFILEIIIGIFVLAILSLIFLNALTGKVTGSLCTDTDGGLNYYVAGTVSNASLSFTDTCVNGTGYNLLEGVCTSSGSITKITFLCTNGCSNGACINITSNTPSNSSAPTNNPLINNTIPQNNTILPQTNNTTSSANAPASSGNSYPQIIQTGYGVTITVQQLRNLQNLSNNTIVVQKPVIASGVKSKSLTPSQQSSLKTIGSQINSTLDSYNLPRTLQTQLNNINVKAATWTANYNSIFLKSDSYKQQILGLKNISSVNLSSSLGSPAKSYLVGSNSQGNLMKLSASSLPAFFDWRNVSGNNYVSPVKDQGQCGSCWAFGAVAALEGDANAFYNNPINPDLSEQDLVSCFLPSYYGSSGCNGASSDEIANIFSNYYQNNGIANETCFPYIASDGSCSNKCSNWQSGAWKTSGYQSINLSGSLSDRINNIKQALINYGPVEVGMYVYEDFFSYVGGIYQHTTNDFAGGHAVTIVGYGTYDGIDYWIVKNSWGPYWGENGYFRIAMGDSYIENWFAFVTSQPISPLSTQQKLCIDNDKDGYCSWGTGTKPSTCPTSCSANSAEDCDDSNSAIFQGCGASTSDTGTLSIISNPSGANIYTADQNSGEFFFRGVTPLTFNLNTGTRTINITETDYMDSVQQVNITKGQTQTLNVALFPAPKLTYPYDDDILRAGSIIQINGTVPANNLSKYTIDYAVESSSGLGSWATTGITLNGNGKTSATNVGIATWDTSSLSNNYYTLRLSVYKTDGSINYVYLKDIYFDTTLKAGWPQRINWFTESFGSVNSNNLVFTDNQSKSVLSVYPNAGNLYRKIYDTRNGNSGVLDIKGNQVLKNENSTLSILSTALKQNYGITISYWAGTLEPAVADVNNDGSKEIFVIAGGSPTRVYGFNSDGSILSGWPVDIPNTDLPGGNLGAPSIADINNDGYKEIIVASGGFTNAEGLYIYNYKGSLLKFIPLEFVSQPTTETSVADLNNDGKMEIIKRYTLPSIMGENLIVFNSSGSVLPGWPELVYNYSSPDGTTGLMCGAFGPSSSPVVGDLNHDGKKEIIVALTRSVFDSGYNNPNNNPWDYIHCEGAVYAFYLNGSIVKGFPVNVDGYILGTPAVGDINNDSHNEIVLTTINSGNINSPNSGVYIINGSGSILTGWPQLKGDYLYSSPALGDINNDGKLEISLSDASTEYIFNSTGNVLFNLAARYSERPIIGDINNDNKPEPIYNNIPWKSSSLFREINALKTSDWTKIDSFTKITEYSDEVTGVLSDIDKNNKTELVSSSDWDYDVITGLDKPRGSIYVWNLNSAYNSSSMPWPMFMHDVQRTGDYNYNSSSSVCIPATCSSLGKTCGSASDGCGGSLSCGSCAAGKTCNSTGQCVCAPNCAGKNCGDNGCGGSCGTCASGQTCTNGNCATSCKTTNQACSFSNYLQSNCCTTSLRCVPNAYSPTSAICSSCVTKGNPAKASAFGTITANVCCSGKDVWVWNWLNSGWKCT